MLGLAVAFFVLALIAAVLGFGGFVAGSLLFAAKACFVVFIVLAILSFIFNRGGGVSTPPDPWE